jgi:hypothetical protein
MAGYALSEVAGRSFILTTMPGSVLRLTLRTSAMAYTEDKLLGYSLSIFTPFCAYAQNGVKR